MSYDDDEDSQAAGAPQEGFEFIGPTTTWRYTSGPENITIDGNTYVPLAGLVRREVKHGTTRDTPDLQVDVPVTTPLIAQYAFGLPPRTLRMKLYRKQAVSGEFKTAWDGAVSSIGARGPIATIVVPTGLGAKLSTNVPSVNVHKHCNHRLGDDRCRVSMVAFTYTATVLGVSDDGRTITVDGVAFGDNWLRGGEIVRDSDGEQRTVVLQTLTVLLVNSPFRTLNNGDDVTMTAGCDHTLPTCEDKFGNELNFGGFASLPTRNPHKAPITLGDD